MKQKNDDEKFKELVKRMKTFNELLGDYLDSLDMDDGDEKEKEDK